MVPPDSSHGSPPSCATASALPGQLFGSRCRSLLAPRNGPLRPAGAVPVTCAASRKPFRYRQHAGECGACPASVDPASWIEPPSYRPRRLGFSERSLIGNGGDGHAQSERTDLVVAPAATTRGADDAVTFPAVAVSSPALTRTVRYCPWLHAGPARSRRALASGLERPIRATRAGNIAGDP